jgi:hypothetical protein
MRRAIGPRSASTQFTTTREVKSPVKSSVSTEYHTARRNIFFSESSRACDLCESADRISQRSIAKEPSLNMTDGAALRLRNLFSLTAPPRRIAMFSLPRRCASLALAAQRGIDGSSLDRRSDEPV